MVMELGSGFGIQLPVFWIGGRLEADGWAMVSIHICEPAIFFICPRTSTNTCNYFSTGVKIQSLTGARRIECNISSVGSSS